MPMVQVTLLEGRSNEQKAELVARVTRAVQESVDVPAERVHVFIYELAAENCGNAGETLATKFGGG